MNKLVFIFIAMSAVFPLKVFPQYIKGYLAAGTNISQIDGDEIKGYKQFGFNGGAGALMALGGGSRWNIGMEVLFSQKGSKEKGEYEVILPYSEIPLLICFEDKGGFTFGTGFSYGRLLSSVEDQESKYLDRTSRFLKNDFNVLADIRFTIWRNLKFDFRFQYSIIPIRRNWVFVDYYGKSWTRNAYNNTISFRLLWVFNEKQDIKRRRNW